MTSVVAQNSAVRALVERVTARPGYTSAVGTRVIDAEPGRVELALERRDDLLQFSGFFHGGVIAGLADHAAGGAVTTALPPDKIALTIDLNVQFYAPADGIRLIAKAQARHVGSTVAHAAVDVLVVTADGTERQCAHATAAFRAVERPTS